MPDGILEELLEAMRWAPSAGNAQPIRIHVVENPDLRAGLVTAALNQRFISQAPLALVMVVDLKEARRAYGTRGENLYCLQDAAASIQTLLLTAHAMDLGTCWVGAFDESAVAELLDLAPHQRPVAIVPVGKPDESPVAPQRKSLDAIVHIHR